MYMCKNTPLRTTLFAILLIFTVVFIPHQSLSQVSSGVNIDELTDEQILNYVKQGEARGLTVVDLENLARQRGLSESDIQKLRTRIQALNSTSTTSEIAQSNLGTRTVTGASQTDLLDYLLVNEPITPTNQIFGLDLFQRSGLTFAPNLNLPTPVDYQLGPGDELIIDLWGAAREFFRLEVSREGTIRPQDIGPISVSGLSIERATERIIERFSQVYSGLKEKEGRPPTVFYQVSLGNIRTINVEIVGAVSRSGLYSLPSLATVYTALHAAGGPSSQGTMRSIRVVRNNKLLTEVDIYSFLTSGVKSGNIRLKDGDVIMVPSFTNRVTLAGLVKIPGQYELLEGESLADLLGFAQGFADAAYENNITVKRNGPAERELFDVSKAQYDSFNPENGDLIEIGRIFSRFANRVVINGAVQRQGEFQLTEGLTLKTLIEKSGGLRGDAFTGSTNIYRVGDDLSQQIIQVDLQQVLNGSANDLMLKADDVVNINSIYDLTEEAYIQVSGEVQQNGTFPYFKEMNLQDLILLSGGLLQSASGAFIEISRRTRANDEGILAEVINVDIGTDLQLSPQDGLISLQPFDQVYVRASTGYATQQQVTVEGEVNAPGLYTITKKGERVSDIINRAKGLSPYAYAKGAILIRTNEFNFIQEAQAITREDLAALRNKISQGQSQLKNTAQEKLMERIDALSTESQRGNVVPLQGQRIKKDLIEGSVERDSLNEDLNLRTREPVALYLEEILANPASIYNFEVTPGDIISIPARLETVRVTGEISTPLNLPYEQSMSFREYVLKAGGFSQYAKKGRSFVQYPNGERQGVRRFLWFKTYPKIQPGSTIVIARKPERAPTNLQSVIAIASSVATLALVVNSLNNN